MMRRDFSALRATHSRTAARMCNACQTQWPCTVNQLIAQIESIQAVLSYREAELMEARGPCRVEGCTLHAAHSGPCNIQGSDTIE